MHLSPSFFLVADAEDKSFCGMSVAIQYEGAALINGKSQGIL